MRRLLKASITATITVLGMFGFISIMCVLSGRTFEQLMGVSFSWLLIVFLFAVAWGGSVILSYARR